MLLLAEKKIHKRYCTLLISSMHLSLFDATYFLPPPPPPPNCSSKALTFLYRRYSSSTGRMSPAVATLRPCACLNDRSKARKVVCSCFFSASRSARRRSVAGEVKEEEEDEVEEVEPVE